MVKWTIEGSLPQPAPGGDEPLLVSEPFLTEGGARQFALLLTERGYLVAARTLGEDGEIATFVDGALVKWMKSD
jgi:hypothetical protein